MRLGFGDSAGAASGSGGLDQVIRDVLQQPYGNPAVVVIALGIASFGVFCFALARHLDR